MASKLRSKVEEHLTCSVCLEQLKDPKVFPCLHSFCHGCIVKLVKKAKSNHINCPECRKVVQVDNADNPSNLPSNFFINNLLATMALTDEKKEQKIQCDNCTDENSAAVRCEECAMFLCSYCSEFHKKSRQTNHHVVATLQELKSGAGPQSVAEKIRCGKHKGELIKLYCKTCQSTICRDCTIVEHRSHDYGFIEDVALGQKEILKRNMNEVQQRQATLQRAIASLKLFDQGLVEENAMVVAQVTSHFDEFQRLVLSKEKELVSKASSLTNLKRKQVNAQIEALEVALASCKSSIEFTEKAFKNGNDVQVLSMQKYILQSLGDLKKVKDETQPCVTRDLSFTIPWSIEDTKKNFFSYFAVDDSVADPDQCQAEFTDQSQHLKRGQRTSVSILCFDKNKTRVKAGGQVINTNISGVDEATIQDNKNGTHTVTFTPRRGGTLKFEATVDGRPAPGCSLTKDVWWGFSDDYGNGEISDGGLTLTGGNHFKQGVCWRVGECSFESGVHTWKVQVKATTDEDNLNRARGFGLQREQYYGYNRSKIICRVGIATTTNGRSSSDHQVQCQLHGEEICVTVELNIPNNSLHLVIESNHQGRSEQDLVINGNKFWPFVQCWPCTKATLKYD